MSVVERVLVRGSRRRASSRAAERRSTCASWPPHQLGAALLYFTGSKGHNIKLRQRALARGLTLNEYALSEIEGGRVVASETEEEIYAALGLPWIPPVLREDAGEIEAAESGALPRPLGDVIGDFHVHTSLSGDGRSTLEEVVAAARARGCRVLAITDHAEGTRVGRRARGAARAARADPRAAGRARRLARAPARRRAEHRAERRARLRRGVPRAPSTGASPRCTTTSSRTAPRRPGAS